MSHLIRHKNDIYNLDLWNHISTASDSNIIYLYSEEDVAPIIFDTIEEKEEFFDSICKITIKTRAAKCV